MQLNWTATLSTLLLAGCAAHLPTVTPELPPGIRLPDVPPSTLVVNARVVLTQLGPKLESSINDNFNSTTYCTAFGMACIRGSVTREPLRLGLRDGHVRLDGMLHYLAEGNFLMIDGSCGKPDNTRRRVEVRYDADLSLGSDWMIRLTNPVLGVVPRDRCEVTAKNIDFTDKITAVLKHELGAFTDRGQAQLTSDPTIRDSARAAWKTISAPIELEPSVNLLLNPQRVSASPLKAGNELLTTTVALTLKPSVHLGAPPPSQASELPALEPLGGGDDRFRLMPLIRMPFDELNRVLTKTAVGKVFSVPGIFGQRHVRITSTSVSGSGERVLVGLLVDGDISGTAWLVGKINYRPADKIATVEVMDLDVVTKDVLVNTIKWFSPSLFLDVARVALADMRFDVGQKTAEFRERARQALNQELSPGMFAQTEIAPVEIRGPFTDESAFLFTALMEGRSTIDIRPGGLPIPSGAEVRFVSVFFRTLGDDKDAEEPVTLTLIKDGRAVATRTVGTLERWGDNPPETQGPYFLTLPFTEGTVGCNALKLRIRKEPAGSRTGKGWKNTMEAKAYFANGNDKVAATSAFSQWGNGDDHPFDRTFDLRTCPQ